MKMIARYVVPLIENAEAEMPINAKFISADLVHGILWVNAIIDVDNNRRKKYKFKVYRNGEHFANLPAGFEFLASLPGGKLHIFKKEKE